MSTHIRPSSPALRSRPLVTTKFLASISAAAGITSFWVNVHAHQAEFAGLAQQALGYHEAFCLDLGSRRHHLVLGECPRTSGRVRRPCAAGPWLPRSFWPRSRQPPASPRFG